MALRDANPLQPLQTKLASPAAMRWMAALGTGLLLGLLAAGAFVVGEARSDTWNQAEQASANLALTLEREIARNIALVDMSVKGRSRPLGAPAWTRPIRRCGTWPCSTVPWARSIWARSSYSDRQERRLPYRTR